MNNRLAQLLVSLALVAVALVGCRGVRATPSARNLPDPHGLALVAADLPGFEVTPGLRPIPSAQIDACPSGPHIYDGTPPVPKSCDTSGFLVESAIQGVGRQQIDAYTREGGNTPDSETPMLPVQGPFVSTHSGIFEVYDYVMVLGSDTAAHDEFLTASRTRAEQLADYRELPTSLADEGKVYRGVLGPDAMTYETQLVTVWRRGNVVGMVNTMGAGDVSEAEHDRLVGVVDARIETMLKG